MTAADRAAVLDAARTCEYWSGVGVEAADAGNLQSAADAAAWAELSALSAFNVVHWAARS